MHDQPVNGYFDLDNQAQFHDVFSKNPALSALLECIVHALITVNSPVLLLRDLQIR